MAKKESGLRLLKLKSQLLKGNGLQLGFIACLMLLIGIRRDYAQGTVLFDTKILGPSALITIGGCPLEGTFYFARLYYGPGSTAGFPLGLPVNFMTGADAGYIQTSGLTSLNAVVNPVLEVPTIAPGVGGAFEIRAWGVDGPDPVASRVFFIPETGIPGDPKRPPALITDFRGFDLRVAPEPGTLVLSLISVGGMLLVGNKRRIWKKP